MNHPDILKKYGTDNVAIRAMFTAQEDKLNPDGETVFNRWISSNYDEKPKGKDLEGLKKKFKDKLYKKRESWENRIANDIYEGRVLGLKNYQFYMSADLAMQAQPIIPDNFPKLLYASGLINFEDCCKQLDELGADKKEKFIVNEKLADGNIKALNLTRLSEFSMNLVKSYVRRRKAAQINKYNSLYPYFKYEARSGQITEKLRADVLSQRAEEIVDQFGYRAQFSQHVEKMLMYSYALVIADSAWQRDRTWQKDSEGDINNIITREGIPFVSPHPTRSFWDTRYPITSLNEDNGVKHFGYWNVLQYKDIKNDKRFFNLDKIPESGSFGDAYELYGPYFNYYFDGCIVKNASSPANSFTEGNNIDTNVAYYNENTADTPLWETEFFVKLTPADEMLGEYPFPVWMKVSVAGDRTIVFGEFRATTPAFVMSYDRMDDKVLSPSMAHEIMPYEDQANNLASQMLHLMKIQSILLVAIDSDQIPKELRDTLMNQLSGKLYYNQPLAFEFSGEQSKQVFSAPNPSAQKRPIHLFQAEVGQAINELLKGISTLLAYLDRSLMMSPNELGQLSERETSASEVQLVSGTTEALSEYVSSGIDAGRAAQKKIIYQSLMAYASKDIKVTVPERYDDRIVAAAGFEPVPPAILESEEGNPVMNVNPGYKLQEFDLTLTGRIEQLSGMEFNYSSRDGINRVSNVQGAKVIAEFMSRIMSSPEIFKMFIDKYGEESMSTMISELWRQAGSPFSLKLPKAPPVISNPNELEDKVDANSQAIAQLLQLANQLVTNGQQQPGQQPAASPGQGTPGLQQVQ